MDHRFGVLRAPQNILFGCGQRHALAAVVKAIGQRVLVCTDRRLSADAQFGALMESLRGAGLQVHVYDGTQAELPIEGVLECVSQVDANRPNVVVGIGGGSCMDMAKLVSLLLAHGGKLDDYYGELKVPGPILPVVAMPTTSGTGSEVTPVAVVADAGRDLKIGVSSPFLIPHTAICDPELTASCPPQLTALSGADAFTHAVEAFTALRREPNSQLGLERVFVGKNALSDTHALAAIQALTEYLPLAVRDGADLEARSAVMLGALHAGLAFGAAGTAAAHAIQYPVGALTHTAHAAGVAVLMPYVMDFNRSACTREFAAIARAMGAVESGEDRMADEAVVRVAQLFESIGIPSTLAALQVAPDQVEWIARQSMNSARLVGNNPRPLDERAMADIVRAALAGRRSGNPSLEQA